MIRGAGTAPASSGGAMVLGLGNGDQEVPVAETKQGARKGAKKAAKRVLQGQKRTRAAIDNLEKALRGALKELKSARRVLGKN